MHIVILTNEFPPHIYGGAGVHVEYLVRELVAADGSAHQVTVFSFGDQDVDEGTLRVVGVDPKFDLPHQDERHAKFLDTAARDLVMAGSVPLDADIVHGHTWYSHLAGMLAQQLTGAKLVLTTHSLEPHRPWKVEQLGAAYHASSWVERTAYQNADGVVAVSQSMKADVQDLYGVPDERLAVIPNGIDPDEYRPVEKPEVLRRVGVDPDIPYVLFVGRITRQKGIVHLVRALKDLDPGVQVVLAAGAPDTKAIAKEMSDAVDAAREARTESGSAPIVWIEEMLPRPDVIALYSHATVFCCPSVYEPFGIINLEAMACETAVVASAVGGIPSIVVTPEDAAATGEAETGLLVPLDGDADSDFEPRDPDAFARDLAAALNTLLADPDRVAAMGRAGRQRVLDRFSWTAIAAETLRFYASLVEG
ncbi:MAG: glycogen synthase [Bacteroidota bacterium]